MLYVYPTSSYTKYITFSYAINRIDSNANELQICHNTLNTIYNTPTMTATFLLTLVNVNKIFENLEMFLNVRIHTYTQKCTYTFQVNGYSQPSVYILRVVDNVDCRDWP